MCKYVIVETMEIKVCTKCETELPATTEYFHKSKRSKDGLYTQCKKCYNAYNRRWRSQNCERSRGASRKYAHNNREKISKHKRKWKYGLTSEQHNQMLAQQKGLCAICSKLETAKDKDGGLSVDHNHKTNKIRGLLCGKCNSALGMLNVDNQGIELLCSAISYVKNTDGV